MIKADEEHFKQINIYLVDGSRYVVIPSDDNLAKYVKGNFYGGYNIGISKNEAKSIIHEWALVKKQYRELSCKYDDLIKKYSELLKDSNRNDNELF